MHHRHQLLPQRNEIRRDVWVVIAEWSRVDAWNIEAGDFEEQQRRLADQGDVEIARARSLRIEWRVVFPSFPGYRTAAQDRRRPSRNDRFDRLTERLEF